MQVEIQDAEEQLDELIELPLHGERVTIARGEVPLVDLVAHKERRVHIGLEEWRDYEAPIDAFDGFDPQLAATFYGVDASGSLPNSSRS